jgi:hypothetical protein
VTHLRFSAALVAGLAATPLSAQHSHSLVGHTQHDTLCQSAAPPWAQLDDAARAQLRAVQASAAAFTSVDAARAAGFRPVLGLIPTMGVHYVNPQRVRRGLDLAEPDHLLFAPVNGEEKLVGIAYAFRHAPDDPVPDAFYGDGDHWHDHPSLAAPGRTLTVLHVWFVPSPDGPFAGHNPWLPFYAVGLEPPDACSIRSEAESVRVRKLALALSETVEPLRLATVLARSLDDDGAAELVRRREQARALIPRLRAAQEARDRVAWDVAAAEGAAAWDAIRSTYLGAVRLPRLRFELQQFLDELVTPNAHGQH